VTIVVDASVALKWVLDEAGSDAAFALRDEELIAPSLWLVEAANALWRRTATGELTARQANARLSALLDAPVASLAMETLVTAALQLASAIDHPVYDCLYLALAIDRTTFVVTADRRFHDVVRRRRALVDRVRLLGA
jgi:predicted nucleic acid-binding protein